MLPLSPVGRNRPRISLRLDLPYPQIGQINLPDKEWPGTADAVDGIISLDKPVVKKS
jgi:hypothetical protein